MLSLYDSSEQTNPQIISFIFIFDWHQGVTPAGMVAAYF